MRRDPDPEDARGAFVRLTRKGERLFNAVAPEHLANEEEMLGALSAAEREALASLLRKLLLTFESRDRA